MFSHLYRRVLIKPKTDRGRVKEGRVRGRRRCGHPSSKRAAQGHTLGTGEEKRSVGDEK